MKKLSLTLATLVSLSSVASIQEATVLKVSKNLNEKNVLHYKVEYDSTRCEFTSDIFADWKMDESDGRWKPLSESMGKIRRPLQPSTSVVSGNEINFETESMEEFRKKKILSSSKVDVFIEPNGSDCLISTEAIVGGEKLLMQEIKSRITIFGNVKSVTVIGENEQGEEVKKNFN